MDKCTKKNLYCKNKNYVTSVFQKTSNKMKGQEETGEKDVRQKKKKEEKLIFLCRKSSDTLLQKKLRVWTMDGENKWLNWLYKIQISNKEWKKFNITSN